MAINPFLKQNKIEEEIIEVPVSDRFVDEKGNPVPFKLRILNNSEVEELQIQATEPVFDSKTRRKIGSELNQEKFGSLLLANAITYPDLGDEELMKSWDAEDKVDLLKKMLDIREMRVLSEAFQDTYYPDWEQQVEAEESTKNA